MSVTGIHRTPEAASTAFRCGSYLMGRTTAALAFEATFPDKREISLGIRQLRQNKNGVSSAFQNFLIEVL
jgi:hypothetical protein